MKAIRFRCPKCRTQHSAIAARAGQAFVCKTCFGPLIVPEGSEAPSPEIPIESRPVGRFGARSRAAAALVLVAAVGAVAGVHRFRDHRDDGFLVAAIPQDDRIARALTAPPIEPTPAPEAIRPAPEARPVEPINPPAPEAKPEPPAPKPDPNRPLVIRRRQMLDQEALRRQLAELPELTADDSTESALIALHHVTPPGRSPASALTAQDRERLKRASQAEHNRARAQVAQGPSVAPDNKPGMHVAREEGAPRDMLAMIREKQPELASLPFQMGDECHLGREAAEDLQVVSRALRTLLAQATPQGDTRPDAELLRATLLEEPREEDPADAQQPQGQAANPGRRRRIANKTRFLVPAAIPALQQLLMAERTPVRLVLVDVLDKIACREAARSLARLSMFDLAPEVRERALLALRARPVEDYRASLLEGLRYPWAPVADHAAEALVALGDREAVPDLVGLLDRPDPSRPRTELRDGRVVTLATSLVQVNHLQNCVLCHAPSANQTLDMVRGRVPDESQPLPPPVEYYANSSPGLFVRADVTYLRQDFSVTQPVQDPGPWPAYQRYDYLITERPATRWSRHLRSADQDEYPQRESVLFALRELTGQDLGNRAVNWKGQVRAKAPAE